MSNAWPVMASEDGPTYVKHLAHFVRTHERALANASQRQSQTPIRHHGGPPNSHGKQPPQPRGLHSLSSRLQSTGAMATLLSLGWSSGSSHNAQAVELCLTPHHLYYLLCKIEEMGISVGSMNTRVEHIHAEASPANYVSFLTQAQRIPGRSDHDSLHSVSSVRSIISSMSQIWKHMADHATSGDNQSDRQEAQRLGDLKYLYSAFTKIPSLTLSPVADMRLISGYEEFPFDTAVPLHSFKNLSVLTMSDIPFRHVSGWDRLADQLRSLTIRRGQIKEPTELLHNVVLEDMDRRRRRASKAQSAPILQWPPTPSKRFSDLAQAQSAITSSPEAKRSSHSTSPSVPLTLDRAFIPGRCASRTKSSSPTRSERKLILDDTQRPLTKTSPKFKRSSSTSSNSSAHSAFLLRRGSSHNLLMRQLPETKWMFLSHLCLADNGLEYLGHTSLSHLNGTLQSLDLSSNRFVELPSCLADLITLRALNLSDCLIETLDTCNQSFVAPLTALNLRGNRLTNLAGIEHLQSLERLDIRDNRIDGAAHCAKLTSLSVIRELWVARNPFTKTDSSHRLTIFNLFREAQGYHEDIQLDMARPNYKERRHLKDRPKKANSFLANPTPSSSGFDLLDPGPASHGSLSIDQRSKAPAILPASPASTLGWGPTLDSRKRPVQATILDLTAHASDILPPKSD